MCRQCVRHGCPQLAGGFIRGEVDARGMALRIPSLVPPRIIDRACPICTSVVRETIDQMLGNRVEFSEIIQYAEVQHLEIDNSVLENHHRRHWATLIREARDIDEARLMNPDVVGANQVEALQQQATHELVNAQFDKVQAVLNIIEQQDTLITLAMEQVTDPESGPSSIRVAKEVLLSKLQSIKVLGQLDGDAVEQGQVNVNVLVQSIAPRIQQFFAGLDTNQKHEIIAQIEQRRMALQEQQSQQETQGYVEVTAEDLEPDSELPPREVLEEEPAMGE